MCAGQAMLEQIAEAILPARAALRREYSKLHKAMLAIVRRDEICRRLMSAPGVVPLDHIQDGERRSGADTKVAAVGALLGLTPRKSQSGETDVTGGCPSASTRWRSSAGVIQWSDDVDASVPRLPW